MIQSKTRSLKKGIILLISLLLFFFLVYGVGKELINRDLNSSRIAELPDFSFTSLKGETFNNSHLPKNMEIVFIYFHSECEFCHYEAQKLSEDFRKTTTMAFVFVSNEDSENVKKFSELYNLNKKNVYFLVDENGDFAETFEADVYPTNYIYGRDGRLLKKIQGPISITKIESLISLSDHEI